MKFPEKMADRINSSRLAAHTGIPLKEYMSKVGEPDNNFSIYLLCPCMVQ